MSRQQYAQLDDPKVGGKGENRADEEANNKLDDQDQQNGLHPTNIQGDGDKDDHNQDENGDD
eukprot:CAMPEP_0116576466 /NCGR_PEP_ID=MMETSP0397-20121206/20543_1 /TAXON_ID=216820 /ORGANISM="Cyclophora tenuis, Strain ECT3854" /LENGTH=61 /DNA_ID=CAMNT_0004105501 /DNA_START=508 /DNA_END=690 /DNA_ORIENTATION=-